MKLAIISDIHGNFIALETVLDALAKEGVDQIICLGDVAATGSQPHEALARLKGVDCPVVMGNTDAWFLDPQPHGGEDEEAQRFTELDLWCAEQLSPADLDYIRTFQATLEHPLDDEATLLCFHGSPQANTDIILGTTPEADLERMLSGFEATLMSGGHTHTQMLRRYKDVVLFNPGSVGLPFEYLRQTGQVRNPPWAEYALITWAGGHLDVAFRRIPVDVKAIVRAAFASGMPHVTWWTKDWG